MSVLWREAAQIKNWIAYDLSWTVEGDIATAVRFEYFDSARFQFCFWRQHIRSSRIAAERDHRGVLEQQQHVADAAFFPEVDEFLLQRESGRVIDPSEL